MALLPVADHCGLGHDGEEKTHGTTQHNKTHTKITKANTNKKNVERGTGGRADGGGADGGPLVHSELNTKTVQK